MRTWLVLVTVVLGVAGGTRGQEPATVSAPQAAVATLQNEENGVQDLFRTNWVMASSSSSSIANDFFLAPALRLSFAEAATALPAAAPKQHTVSHPDNYRLQLGLGFTYVRFRSPAIHVGLYGLNTSVAYLQRKWLGYEANFTAAFGPHIFNNNIDQTRYAGISGGPKILWPKGDWEPWVHALVGAAHVNPQLGDVSKNGVGTELGGGMDFQAFHGLWLRAEGDYLRSQLYGTGQNNFQVVVGVVFHFF